MQFKHLWLVLFALAVRFQTFIPLNKIEIVSLELGLLVPYFFVNRMQLRKLLLKFDSIKTDCFIGTIVGVLYCCCEYGWDRLTGAESQSIYLNSILLLPVALAIVGWASALYEELLFRSAVLSYCERRLGNPAIAIAVQGILFGLAHWKRYFHEGMWYHALSTTAFGLALGLLAWKRRSFIPGWVAHALSNTYGVIFIPPALVLGKAIGSWLH